MIASLARAHPDDIDKAHDALKAADRFRIHVFMSTSAIHMEKMLRLTPDEVMKASIEGVRRARGYTDDVEFSPQDATRSDPDFMIAVCKAAVEAGATTINIPDTVGFATPIEFAELLKRVFKEVRGDREDVVMSVHCHNDLGLAVANSLASLAAGARQIEGAINGIGERAGNTSIEEVVMAIKTRQDVYGVDLGVDTTQLYDTSRLVARLTGYPVQYNKAVVGRNAFAHESGIHQHGVLRDQGDLRDHGCRRRRAAGRPDRARQALGPGRVPRRPQQDGHHPRGRGLHPGLRALQAAGGSQDPDRRGRGRAIVEDQTGESTEKVKMVSLHVAGGNEVTPTATVRVIKDGVEQTYTGQGDGMVHATFAALRLAFETEARLIDYRVVPVTSGADAMAEVNVVVRVGDRTFAGHSLNTDVVEGSAEAFANALNKAG